MKTSKPLISVILSVFNDEKNIRESIESILNQTYSNIELLIMDDCSTDKTYEIVTSIKDERIKNFQNRANLGLTKSLNILINNSKGDLIARQDSDDISSPSRIENQYNYLISNNLDACTTRAKIKNTKKIIPRFSYLLSEKLVMKYKNPFIHGTLLVYREALEGVGLYNEKYKYAQDYKLYKDLIRNNYKIKIMNDPLYVLNMKNNISTINKKEQRYYFDLIRKSD